MSRWTAALSTVRWVANTPMTPVLVAKAAGLMAGSIPIMGTAVIARKAGKATTLAVLHATTTALHD